MERDPIREQLQTIIAPDLLNDWELEEQAEAISTFPPHLRPDILRLYGVIWPVSHALCSRFLAELPKALDCLAPDQLDEWVRAFLAVYEKEGLHQAGAFMADVENRFLCRLRGESGVSLTEVAGRLKPYLQGLGGRFLEIGSAPEPATDTGTIFLPPEIRLGRTTAENALLYKLIASFQWGFIACGTYRWSPEDHPDLVDDLVGRYHRSAGNLPGLARFFQLFPDALLAEELFLTLESIRVCRFLMRHLPGLMRDVIPLSPQLLKDRPDPGALAPGAAAIERLKQWLAQWLPPLESSDQEVLFQEIAGRLSAENGHRSCQDSALLTRAFYDRLAAAPGDYLPTPPLPFQGRLDPVAAWNTRLRRREEQRQRFIQALAGLLPSPTTLAGDPRPLPESSPRPTASDGTLLLLASRQPAAPTDDEFAAGPDEPIRFLTINDQRINLSQEAGKLAREISQDLGTIPREYLASAVGLAGQGSGPGTPPAAGEEAGQPARGPILYDEWDFRRHGFRKDWCVLYQKELRPVRGSFVEATLEKHQGLLRRLRRQFELMRTESRFLRRQKEGDDLDLDAVVESLADQRAGRAGSERLFIRLQRAERSISAAFLVDMSSSTEGWIGTAIKESLILMCEALEVLGDRYAVYGFSGMRRLRSELFHIKGFSEAYSEEVKGRIAAITPQDYTRMGPPIRHLSRLLSDTDGRTRLLITLSDGKPEDYDDYKGDYAIEDTRHALIEAKAMGIHPFCITIDRRAQEYIRHMYGEVNYIFIDQVDKLPNRMPEIYRTLTS